MEIWKTIFRFKDYKISNLGNVKMTANNASRKERILKPLVTNRGYYRVALYKNKKPSFFSIHRLVAKHFIPNPENKKQVNHKDGDKSNNISTNLEWNTGRENKNHAITNKLYASGEKNGRAKLSQAQVDEIRNSTLNQYKLAEKYNVSQGTISRIKTRKGWN